MKLAKAMVTVAGLTGLSRLAGFVRDILTASVLGTGPVADAFFVALKLPNFFRRVTAEGAFSVSFVPLYTEAMEQEGREKADVFAGNAMGVMFWTLLVFTIGIMLAMPWVINLIAPGFGDDPVRHDLATTLSRITFPYLLMMSLAALLGGVLNAHGRFAPFAAAPILFNLSLIALLLIAWKFETPGHALSWGVLIAGVLQFVMLWIFARREKIKIQLRRPKIDLRMKRLFGLMGPGVIGAGVMHVNLFADVIIASMLDTGSISYLYYADRLNQLPLGMVGIAVGTALLPMLSRALSAGDEKEARDLFNRALEYCLLLALPAATGLFVISWPIVVTLFHHGVFTWEAAWNTTAVLTAYCIGMPAYIAMKVFSTAFWAKQDTATPVKVSVVCTVFNIVMGLYLVFVAQVGVVGVAVATAMAGWLQIGLFLFFLRRRAETRFDARFIRNALKIVMSCALMAAGLVAAKRLTFHLYDPALEYGVFAQALGLAGLVLSGMIIYSLAIFGSGVMRADMIGKYFKRPKNKRSQR
jgi:putative peptidoglycan lipid II flippase